MNTDKKKEKLSFYTNGESFTGLIRMFFDEGNLERAFNILEKLPQRVQMQIYWGEMKFEGDTREGDGTLLVVPVENPVPPARDLAQIFWWKIFCNVYVEDKLSLESYKNAVNEYFRDIAIKNPYDYENFRLYCTRILGFDKMTWVEDYLNSLEGAIHENILNEIDHVYGDDGKNSGIILPNGRIFWFGYDHHKYIQPILTELGIDDGQENSSEKVLRISSGELNGTKVHAFLDRMSFNKHIQFSQAELDTLFKYRYKLKTPFGHRTVAAELAKFYGREENLGTKYGNLMYLKKHYPEIKIPKFSRMTDTELYSKTFFRTSLERQYAGIVDSVLHDIPEIAAEKIRKQWNALDEKFKRYNECFIFRQEYIEGELGVINYFDGVFQTSHSRGHELTELVVDLSRSQDRDIQVEFVVSNKSGHVYVLEFKSFEKITCGTSLDFYEREYKFFMDVKPYCGDGSVTGKIGENILYIDRDIENPGELLNYDAVLCEGDNMQFLHTLALARHLNLTAMFSVPNIDYTGELVLVGKHGKIYKKHV